MTKQTEALRLADLQNAGCFEEWSNTAKELRRLHEVNQELLEALKEYVDFDPVDVEMNPIKRQALAAIAKGEQQ